MSSAVVLVLLSLYGSRPDHQGVACGTYTRNPRSTPYLVAACSVHRR
jgi:hypothetical protein